MLEIIGALAITIALGWAFLFGSSIFYWKWLGGDTSGIGFLEWALSGMMVIASATVWWLVVGQSINISFD